MQLMSSKLSQDAAFMLVFMIFCLMRAEVSCPVPLGGEDCVCAERTCSREAAICSSSLLSMFLYWLDKVVGLARCSLAVDVESGHECVCPDEARIR